MEGDSSEMTKFVVPNGKKPSEVSGRTFRTRFSNSMGEPDRDKDAIIRSALARQTKPIPLCRRRNQFAHRNSALLPHEKPV